MSNFADFLKKDVQMNFSNEKKSSTINYIPKRDCYFEGKTFFNFIDSEEKLEDYAKLIVYNKISQHSFLEMMSEMLLKSLLFYILATRTDDIECNLENCIELIEEKMSDSAEESILTYMMHNLPPDHPTRLFYASIEPLPKQTFIDVREKLRQKLYEAIFDI